MRPERERITAQLQADAADHVASVCGDVETKIEMLRALTDDQKVRVAQLESTLEVLDKKLELRASGGDPGSADDFATAYLRVLAKLHTDAWMVESIAIDLIKDMTDKIEKWKGQKKS